MGHEIITLEEYRNYVVLTDAMSCLAGQFFMLSEGEPLSHQLIWCKDIKEPLSEVEWAKIVAANDGHLPSEEGAWEKWDRFPDLTGCSHYFGNGAESDVSDFLDMIKRGQTILDQYWELDVPEQLQWKLPNDFRLCMGLSLSSYHCFLEFLCRQSFANYNTRGYYLTDVRNLQGVDLTKVRIIQQDDAFGAASQALEAWLPRSSFEIEFPEIHEPVAKSVTFGWGERSYWAMSDGGRKISFGESAKPLLDEFVRKVALKSPGEIVTFRELHDAISEVDPKPGVASDGLRKAIGILKGKLDSLGQIPEGVHWMICQRGMGYYLNESVKWDIDRESLGRRKSNSGWSFWQDADRMAENTVDKDHKLPAMPYRPKNDHEDDDN